VVWWDVRGTEPDSPPWHVERQLEDLEAVLNLSGADRCHLVGWCTGAKIATAFQQRRPDMVASMVFLNGTFKQDGLWSGMDTRYERDLEIACRALDRNPQKAGRLTGLLAAGAAGKAESPGSQGAGVLGVLSQALTDEVRRPFREPSVLLRYARQLIDLWRLDTAGQAAAVTAPVLFVCSASDGISSSARARAASRYFPHMKYAELAYASHYVAHDRSALIAELITEFVTAPELIADAVAFGEVRWEGNQ
jgi:pimeloyl-ACP methyl ester carboxylesterase